jgi:hypothetical protein
MRQQRQAWSAVGDSAGRRARTFTRASRALAGRCELVGILQREKIWMDGYAGSLRGHVAAAL